MKTEELVQQALAALSGLPQDEVNILHEHHGTKDVHDLARRIAQSAEELWSPAEESGVQPEDWVEEYIRVTIDLFHDQKRAFEAQELRELAAEYVDEMPARDRALVCCMFRTNRRERVASLTAKLATKAIVDGLVARSEPKQAIQRVLDVHLAAYTDHVDAHYFHIPPANDPRSA
jgi:hypothetical protein